MNAPAFGGLALLLVNEGVVDSTVMQKALAESQSQNLGLIQYLVENKLAPSNKIAVLVSKEFGDPLFDLNALNTSIVPKDLVDEKIISQYNVLPLMKRGNRLFVADRKSVV